MKLSLEAIEIIDAIERSGSMTGAANLLFKVPSSISYSISKLEEQLQLALFVRNGPRLSLTPAGQALLNEGRYLLRAVADLEHRLHRIASGYESELRIVYDSVLPSQLLIDDLSAFAELDCGTRLRLTAEVMTGVWEALHQDRADLIIATGDCPKWRGYQVVQIDEIAFAFCVAADHPLTLIEGKLNSEQLQNYSVIAVADSARALPTRSVGLLSGQRRITVANMQAKIELQQRGLGIGFVPRTLVAPLLANGSMVELDLNDAPRTDPVWLAMRSDEQGEAARWWFNRLNRRLWQQPL